MGTKIARERAALRRRTLSRPLRHALEDGFVPDGASVFDFGCGHGDDLRELRARGVDAEGWDPALRPDVDLRAADVVNLGYVLNVIENVEERRETLRQAWALARHVLVVAVRTVHDRRELLGQALGDGLVTKRSTFQKFFEPAEAMNFVAATLEAPPVAVGPGVYYVFRDEQSREAFAASRIRRAPAKVRLSPIERYERHRDVLAPVVEFLQARGRLPSQAELDTSRIVEALGSFARARRVVVEAVGVDAIERAAVARSEDLLVYLALARFARRPRFSALPPTLQQDLRALFRSYDRACALADEVLVHVGRREPIEQAFREAAVGKLTQGALYVHATALNELPPLLRIYEGCARSYVGGVEGANIVKLHRDAPAVSYLAYPTFDRDPHPALSFSLLVGLRSLKVESRHYDASSNPPVLHRKETFVGADYPKRDLFARLTLAEERAGLLDESRTIGTRTGWGEALQQRGLKLRGHRLVVAASARLDRA